MSCFGGSSVIPRTQTSPPEPLPSLDLGHAFTGPLADPLTLHLSERRDHVGRRVTGHGPRVNAEVETDNRPALVLGVLQDAGEVRDQAREPVSPSRIGATGCPRQGSYPIPWRVRRARCCASG